MTIDMSQFYQVFFEETEEHLAAMESLLLALDVEAPLPDELNAIFRAAHSIKGGSGTFGFTDMTELTHELETLLDRLRKQELVLRLEMIDAFLEARDLLCAQLEAHKNGGPAGSIDISAVCLLLKTLATGSVAEAVVTNTADPGAAQAGGTALSIEFQSSGEAAVMDELMKSLSALGTLEITEKPAPGAAGSDGVWKLSLQTRESESRVRELFEFVTDPETVRIAVVAASTSPAGGEGYGFFNDDPVAAAISPAAPAAAPDTGYGFFENAPGAVAATAGSGTSAAETSADCGYGFFNDAPGIAVSPEASGNVMHGRRAIDQPGVIEIKAGRRADDPPKSNSNSNPGRRAVDRAANSSAETTSIRVSVDKVDTLINLVGELVITQAMLTQTAANGESGQNEKLSNGLSQLERNTRDLQEAVMSIRMMPMSFVFSRFPRVVRDVAGKLGKKVELKTEGEATELDKGLIEKLADPLTHLVRNSLDHGLEMADVRVAAGKPATGTITLRAFHQGGNIFVEVIDDGAGLPRDKILAKARERGMAVSDSMPDQEVYSLIFEAGFSTAEKITDVSGRGVGMDVVRRNIREMGGSVEIDSSLGHGTRISIRLPLTLAILDGLSVSVGDERFIVPLTYITESLQPAATDIKSLGNQARVVQVRGEYLPVVALHEVFGLQPRVTELDRGIMVILESDGARTALFVDELLGQHQVVIKSLETNYRRVHGVSGATIMGDGRVALILDAASLVVRSDPQLARAA